METGKYVSDLPCYASLLRAVEEHGEDIALVDRVSHILMKY